MKCPVCADATLVMSERHGIEIDYCPTCRGVWLDRGELDKIIERSTEPRGAPTAPQPAQEARRYSRDSSDDRYERDPRRKRRSFLDEIFDF